MRSLPFELRNSHGDPLRGDVWLPDAPGAQAAVVVCHGFKGFKNWGFFPYVAERLAQSGFTSVAFNFSGSGIGPDLMNFTELDRFAADTMSRQVEDLGRVLDAVEAGEIASGRADLRRVGVLGHSRGGAAAIVRAREDQRVRAVAIWNSVSSLMRYSERELESWRERGFMEFLNTRTGQTMRLNYTAVEDANEHRARFDLLRAVSELRTPLLVVHAEEDLTVPVREGRELFAAADADRSELFIVPRAGHTFGVEHPWKGTTPALERAIERTIGWFRTSLGERDGGSEAV